MWFDLLDKLQTVNTFLIHADSAENSRTDNTSHFALAKIGNSRTADCPLQSNNHADNLLGHTTGFCPFAISFLILIIAFCGQPSAQQTIRIASFSSNATTSRLNLPASCSTVTKYVFILVPSAYGLAAAQLLPETVFVDMTHDSRLSHPFCAHWVRIPSLISNKKWQR